jgi:hypothetical protein
MTKNPVERLEYDVMTRNPVKPVGYNTLGVISLNPWNRTFIMAVNEMEPLRCGIIAWNSRSRTMVKHGNEPVNYDKIIESNRNISFHIETQTCK